MKFYSMKNILQVCKDRKIHYALLMGGRNIGKSYQVKKYILEKMYTDSCAKFIYLRREDEDIKTDLCQGYFADMDISAITEGTYNDILVYQKKIYFCRRSDDTGLIEEKKQIGYCHALRQATHYKSVMFPDVTDVIFEEFVPDGKPYLAREPVKLQEYISTIFRVREGCCWLIGNTISKLNPYVDAWKLTGVHRMKTHQIDVYTQTVQVQTDSGLESHDVNVAVEACGAEGLLSKMAFGSGANQIIKNEYRSFQQPTVEASYISDCCDCLYIIFFFYKNLKFKMCFMQDTDKEDTFFWYVKPADGALNIDDLSEERVVCEDADFNPLHTGMHPISVKEKKVFDYLAKNKIFYSDDMTGTDFQSCFQSILRRG